MVYSGFIAVYGFEVQLSSLLKKLGVEESDDVDTVDLVNDFLQKKGFKVIKLITKRCCYNDGEVFIGVYLGRTDFVYRDDVRDFDSFDEYENVQKKELDRIKQNYNENKNDADMELKKFKLEYPEENESDEEVETIVRFWKKIQQKQQKKKQIREKFELGSVKIFTFANDCDRCS